MKKTKFNQWTQLLYCNELSGNELRVLMLILKLIMVLLKKYLIIMRLGITKEL